MYKRITHVVKSRVYHQEQPKLDRNRQRQCSHVSEVLMVLGNFKYKDLEWAYCVRGIALKRLETVIMVYTRGREHIHNGVYFSSVYLFLI
jgi:hypothetical protein